MSAEMDGGREYGGRVTKPAIIKSSCQLKLNLGRGKRHDNAEPTYDNELEN
jgi:hypothetical protein